MKYVTLNERTPLHHFTMPARQVVKCNRIQSVGRQSLARVGADESSTACYEDRLHFVPSPSRARGWLHATGCRRSAGPPRMAIVFTPVAKTKAGVCVSTVSIVCGRTDPSQASTFPSVSLNRIERRRRRRRRRSLANAGGQGRGFVGQSVRSFEMPSLLRSAPARESSGALRRSWTPPRSTLRVGLADLPL